MNEALDRPLPSGFSNSPESFDLLLYLQDLGAEYLPWFFLLIVISAICKLIWNSFHREKMRLEKLKKFLVFFLSKRQMMLPLVYTFAKRDQVLDENILTKILTLREKAKEMSFKKNLPERMQLEKEVSKILFQYFSFMEKEGKIEPHSKLSNVVADLEFIDEKLVELQKVYNNEVTIWNNKVIPLRNLISLPKYQYLQGSGI
ncbi:LemA family protein [Candidatus Gracilibacteria bacterium]|nr:LemA family protein [Candidatus Gracilibacteria bacterium]